MHKIILFCTLLFTILFFQNCKKTIHDPCGPVFTYYLQIVPDNASSLSAHIASDTLGLKRRFFIFDSVPYVCPNALIELSFDMTFSSVLNSRNFTANAFTYWHKTYKVSYPLDFTLGSSEISYKGSGILDIRPQYHDSVGYFEPVLIFTFDSYGNYNTDSVYFFNHIESVKIKEIYNEVK